MSFARAVGRCALLGTVACAPAEAPRGADSMATTDGQATTTTRATSLPTNTAACVSAARTPYQPAAVGAARFVVNRGTRGMMSRVRWLLSPDSSALLVMDDPVSVEGEAVPNGVLFASERTGRVWRMDSVWTAEPSPDWRAVAVGRAVVLGGGEAQQVDPARWTAAAASLARLAGPAPALVADSLRARAFPVSGMAVVEGAAATFVADVSRDVADAPLRFVALGGWRLAWSCDGADLLVGDRPRQVQDDSPASTEQRVSARGEPLSAAPRADSLRWIMGPTLEISADAAASTRPLAVTRNGRFRLVIAPRAAPRSYESPVEAVVYRVP